jgi:hypothetical protein
MWARNGQEKRRKNLNQGKKMRILRGEERLMTRKEHALISSIQRLQLSAGNAIPPRRIRSDSRIMYIERKSGGLVGEARIGRVTFSRTGCTLYYKDQCFQSLKGAGFKSNYANVDSGEDYWISGPKRDGCDRLYGERLPVEIDDDVREEYWRTIRCQPDLCGKRTT